MNTSVGLLISKYRKAKKKEDGHYLSQLDLSLIIGWENPSTLSRIEGGQVIPTRNTVIRIGQALSLKKIDMDILLDACNYSLFEPSLTFKYKKEVLNSLTKQVESYNYPIFIQLGNSGKIVYWNCIAERVFLARFPDSEKIGELCRTKTFIDVLFDDYFNIKQNVVNWDDLSAVVTENMYATYLSRPMDKKFFNKCIEWQKYPDFQENWIKLQHCPNVENRVFNMNLIFKHPLVGDIQFTITTNFWNADKRFIVEHIAPRSTDDSRKLMKIKFS